MMKRMLSKQWEVLAIAWTKTSDFKKAMIKMTVYYLLVIFMLLNIFVFSLFFVLEKESDKYEQNINTFFEKKETIVFDKNSSLTIVSIEQPGIVIKKDSEFMKFHNIFVGILRERLFLIELVLLIFGGFLSYFLAGIGMRTIEKKNNEQKRFLSDVSHELKNPLSAIKMSLEISKNQKKWKIGETKEVFEDLEKEVSRLINITNNILKLENIDKKSKKEYIFVSKKIENIISKLYIFIKNKNINISLNIKDFYMNISRHDIETMLYNIIHNAIKFSKNNSDIEISLSDKGILKIKDYGIGIEKDNLDKIFDRFYKIDDSRFINKESGSGLGLSIVKKIADKNNIKIKVKSSKGEGVEFIIFLI